MAGLTLNLVQYRPHGLVKDLPPIEAGPEAYTQVQNFYFDDDAAVRAPGWQERYGPPIVPPVSVYSVLEQGLGDEPWWVYTAPSHIGVTGSVGTFDITPVGGVSAQADRNWTFSQISRFPTINNGIDVPWFWQFNEANPAIPLPGFWVGSCSALRSYKNFLIAMNITDAGVNIPELVRWSAAAGVGAVPATWIPAQDNFAGDVSLTDTPGAVVDGRQLRDSFIMYKDSSTFIMDFIGGQFVMSTRMLFRTSGILTDNCALEAYGSHFVFTQDDMIRHDGHDAISIAQSKIKREVFGQIDPDNYRNSYVMASTFRDEIWFCYPETGAPGGYCNKAAVWDLQGDEWGIRDLPQSVHGERGYTGLAAVDGGEWDLQTVPWDIAVRKWNEVTYSPIREGLIVADPVANKLFVMDNSELQDGTIVDAYIAKETMDLGQREAVKLIQGIWPRISGTASQVIKVRVGTQMFIEGAIEWGAELDFIVGETEKVDTFASGRFISISFATNSIHPYRIEGFGLEYRLQGNY